MAESHTPTTGTPTAGVPVVDLTTTTNALLERAEWLRVEARNLIETAGNMRTTAEHLENVVSLLHGGAL